MTSSNGNIFRVTGHLCGEFTRQRWIPHTKASDEELYVFFDLRLNKQLSKQSWGWWSETPKRSFWRQCNVRDSHLSFVISQTQSHKYHIIIPKHIKKYIGGIAISDHTVHHIQISMPWRDVQNGTVVNETIGWVVLSKSDKTQMSLSALKIEPSNRSHGMLSPRTI